MLYKLLANPIYIGKLLYGRTQSVTFPVDLRTEGDRARMTGSLSLDRTAFGIGTSGPLNGLIAARLLDGVGDLLNGVGGGVGHGGDGSRFSLRGIDRGLLFAF